jgi:hypothetical protein
LGRCIENKIECKESIPAKQHTSSYQRRNAELSLAISAHVHQSALVLIHNLLKHSLTKCSKSGMLLFSDRKSQSQYLSDADRLLGLLSELLVGRNLNTCEGKKKPNVNISSAKPT